MSTEKQETQSMPVEPNVEKQETQSMPEEPNLEQPVQSQDEADAIQARIEQAKAAYPEGAERPNTTDEFLALAESRLDEWKQQQAGQTDKSEDSLA